MERLLKQKLTIRTSSDDSVTAIDEQLKLLNAAQDDLYITSHPQYQYTTDLDNFLGLYDFKEYSEKLNIGDYLYLSVRDDYVVKLRIISMEYNPLCYDNSLQITFSNMIQSRSSRDDIAYILNQSGGSSKNSSTGSSSSNNYLNNEGVSLTPALIQKLVQSGAFQNQLNNIINNNFGSYLGSNGGSISISELNAKMIKVVDIVGENAFFEYLQSKFISTDTIVAGSGKFKDLQALVAQIDNLLAEKEVVKNFTWTKTKSGEQGQSGQNARLFSLDTSTYVIKKNTDDTLTPSTIIFSSYYKDGESDTRNDYLGRFLISESTDGLKYSTKYTSAKDEHTVTYTPSSSSISSIKCILCASGGITNELDSQTVVVLTDADGVNEKIKEITETISGVSSKVDAVNKSITDKVWQSDITNSIDNYDKTTIKIIRDQQSKQETTIEGITSTVSDVQSKVEKKADGSTVQELSERVSTNEQTAEGFRQEVIKNYVTNDKLKDYPTNGQMKTAISESAKEINLSASKTYATKSESATGSEVQYYVSTSSTSLIGGEWSSGTPIWESGKYIWSKTVTTKADGTTSESNPVCIQGAKGENGIGEKGETGTGIVSITPQYYLSSSKTTQTDGSWIDNTAPSWEAGKYMWTRNKIVYSNPSSTVYTEPYCDTSWEAANEVRTELSVRADEIEGKVTDNKKNITEVIQTNKQIQQSVTDANNNITKLQQDSSSFKQEVEKTYMTKNGLNSLKIGGRNLLRNSNTLEFEDYYFVGGTTSYMVDSDGNYVVDEENNMIITI